MNEETETENHTPSQTIYGMQLHDLVDAGVGNITVLRVPGGWIYTIPTLNKQHGTSVFVRWDNEFQPPLLGPPK